MVKSLELTGSGPVGLIRTQKVQFFSDKNPTLVAESYKTTYWHKLT